MNIIFGGLIYFTYLYPIKFKTYYTMKKQDLDFSEGGQDDVVRIYRTELDLTKVPENFDVTICSDGTIDYFDNVGGIVFPLGSQTVEEFNGEEISEEMENLLTELVSEWVKNDYIPLGEKTELTVWNLGERKFNLIGQVCTELGEDWDSDEWDTIDVFIDC